jgi:hypothetical protein
MKRRVIIYFGKEDEVLEKGGESSRVEFEKPLPLPPILPKAGGI